ncbi:MAG: RNA methyltransferase [Oscillospiraceae bacterium]
MEKKLVTSRQNPLCAHLRKLAKSGGYRRETGEYLADGEKLWQEAVRWGVPVKRVVTITKSSFGAGLTVPEGVEHIEVPSELMAYLSPMETPQGVLFTVERREWSLPAPEKGRYLALDGLQDPGNVGTIWRTADALGADGLFLLNHCADSFHPKTVRSTMGACFRLPAWEVSLDQLKEFAAESGMTLCAAALGKDCQTLGIFDLKGCLPVIGNEGHGISEEVLAACGRRVMIPMRERCESLNAAAAATVMLWELGRG